MLRVIQFFKSNNEILLVHSSRYEVFMQSILTQLGQRVQINYSYIRQATPTEIADKDYTTEKLIYLHQEGNYISITPVMKYGNVEIPVYSASSCWIPTRTEMNLKLNVTTMLKSG